MAERKTTADFISRAKAVHGSKYDYSETSYVARKTALAIRCPAHGVFWQLPFVHYTGSGCPGCSADKQRLTETDILERLRDAHGDRFDYSEAEFDGATGRITVICRKHGKFRVRLVNHLKTRTGCRGCASDDRTYMTSEVVAQFKNVHGNRYDYSQFTYESMHNLASMVCPKHGKFRQTPANHLSGHGCASCTNNAHSNEENAWISAIENELGQPARRSVRVSMPKGGAIDAVFGNVAVEYDGAYWHSLAGAFEKDTRKTAVAIQDGFSVVRLRAIDPKHPRLLDIPQALNLHVPNIVQVAALHTVLTAIRKAMK